jgi:hypothetical protein
VDDDGGRGRTAVVGGGPGEHDGESWHTAGAQRVVSGHQGGLREDVRDLGVAEGGRVPGAHTGFFDLAGKRERLERGEKPNRFIDPAGYQAWVAATKANFDKLVAEERLR